MYTPAQQKILQARKIKRHIRQEQEAWGNRNFSEIELPAGREIQEYVAELNKAAIYSYPRFRIEDGQIIEEFYYSIGD